MLEAVASPCGRSIVPPKQVHKDRIGVHVDSDMKINADHVTSAWEEGFTDEIVDIKLDEFQPLDEFLAFCDSSQEATPLQLIIAPCHVLVELWRATGCYQTCRKLALADLVKSSCAVV